MGSTFRVEFDRCSADPAVRFLPPHPHLPSPLGDSACSGWRTDDNKTATLLTGHISASSDDCVGGKKHFSHHGGAGTNWGSAGDLGGFWYSTPITAGCKNGAPLGTDGCA